MKSLLRHTGRALALGAVLFVGACSDDDNTTPSTPNAPPPAAPTPAPAETPAAEPTPTAAPTGNVTGVQGKVRAIDGTDLRVGDVDVDVTEATELVREFQGAVPFTELQVGDFVRVRGTMSGDGETITAIRITIITDK